MVALPVARSGAMQVVLLGRASSPLVCASLPPLLSQPAIRKKTKDNNFPVVCLA
jgi:hypothetical protein